MNIYGIGIEWSSMQRQRRMWKASRADIRSEHARSQYRSCVAEPRIAIDAQNQEMGASWINSHVGNSGVMPSSYRAHRFIINHRQVALLSSWEIRSVLLASEQSKTRTLLDAVARGTVPIPRFPEPCPALLLLLQKHVCGQKHASDFCTYMASVWARPLYMAKSAPQSPRPRSPEPPHVPIGLIRMIKPSYFRHFTTANNKSGPECFRCY